MTTQRFLRSMLILGLLVVVGACAYPESSVRAVEENPALVIKGAPDTARVRVDGIDTGLAADYSGDYSLSVLPGRHVVEVLDDGRVLLREEVFLSAGTLKILNVSGSE